jgi:hypothetical protein
MAIEGHICTFAKLGCFEIICKNKKKTPPLLDYLNPDLQHTSRRKIHNGYKTHSLQNGIQNLTFLGLA